MNFHCRVQANIKSTSDAYRDQMQSPLDTAIYWVEYMAKHNGATHMQSHAKQMNYTQYHNWDVIAGIVLVIGIVCKLIVTLVKWIYWGMIRRICQSGRKVKGE